MNVFIIILGSLLILSGFKMIGKSNQHKKDWEHWSNIIGSDIGTKAHTNYIVTVVLGWILAISGAFVMIAAL